MKKLLLALVLLASPVFATTTDRLGLDLIDDGTTPWGDAVRDNYELIDEQTAALDQPNIFSTYNVFSTSVSIATATLNQVRIATPTYSGTETMVINGTTKIFGPLGAVLSLCDQNGQNCSNISSATISGVTAGVGLAGGGTSGAIGLSLRSDSTNYIQNSNSLQAGATVYVSSGTFATYWSAGTSANFIGTQLSGLSWDQTAHSATLNGVLVLGSQHGGLQTSDIQDSSSRSRIWYRDSSSNICSGTSCSGSTNSINIGNSIGTGGLWADAVTVGNSAIGHTRSVVIGHSAGGASSPGSGTDSVIIGYNATGAAALASSNVVVGANTSYGSGAGSSTRLTLIGNSANSSNGILNSMALGYNAQVTASSTSVIGGSATNVVIGETAGTDRQYLLEVNGSVNSLYGIKAATLTVSGLNSGECVQTSAGGRLTTTGAACGSGGGSSVYAASATASFPFGFSASTGVFNGTGITVSTIAFSNTANGGIKGTITNDSAGGGFVGEYIEIKSGGQAVGTSAQYHDIATFPLTAGDWDVSTVVVLVRNGATLSSTDIETCIGTTTGNSAAGCSLGENYIVGNGVSAITVADYPMSIAPYRVSISAATTKYLKGYVEYSAGAPQWAYRISARRVR